MQYDPKLKKAAHEINEVLKKYNIAGLIFLHTPGHGEYVVKIDPKYSCAFIDGNNFRIRSKLSDYNGNEEAKRVALENTLNMLKMLTDMSCPIIFNMLNASKVVDDICKAEHYGGGH